MTTFVDPIEGRKLARQLLGMAEPEHAPERRGIVLHGSFCFQGGILACGVPDAPEHAKHPTDLYLAGGLADWAGHR